MVTCTTPPFRAAVRLNSGVRRLPVQSENPLIPLIFTLIRAGDADLLQKDHVLAPACPPQHRQDVRAASALLATVYAQYDFVQSPAFQQEVASKSASYASMLAKRYREPTMRGQKRSELLEALRNLTDSDAAFSLVAVELHPQLEEARHALQQALRA